MIARGKDRFKAEVTRKGVVVLQGIGHRFVKDTWEMVVFQAAADKGSWVDFVSDSFSDTLTNIA